MVKTVWGLRQPFCNKICSESSDTIHYNNFSDDRFFNLDDFETDLVPLRVDLPVLVAGD